MKRRDFLGGLIAGAGLLALPGPRRIYSLPSVAFLSRHALQLEIDRAARMGGGIISGDWLIHDTLTLRDGVHLDGCRIVVSPTVGPDIAEYAGPPFGRTIVRNCVFARGKGPLVAAITAAAGRRYGG